ncbi:circularly permuted type 2 ATP-grasp protein [Sphingomonas japonica]|uniref:Circularly permuted ATP-grasp superfamily protein/putative alpha-E superfamily protein n=1 Tax=Sphingomonas japonica TaxID=511662 RepID=A0ABX0TYR3_9SPHN|nr:circularly permuted type 2 ATP-grasp protein [Sphingomonas japonica]NIJ23450.1 putative circularly permuted ATP-grasp superfamily protein/putative alpha-E superfamily protein [Sphingomonas japonica]
MASQVAGLFDAGIIADRWIAEYCGGRPRGDVLCGTDGDARIAWQALLEELATASGDSLTQARERAQRQADDIGTGFRIAGESDERPWPLSPIPLLIDAADWAEIDAGVRQRADLFETVLADLYGEGRLVAQGLIPAALVTGSPYFLRPMLGLDPPGGHHLHFMAVDLCRGPTGEWRVLGDQLRAPTGAGYALENRLAIARTLGGLQGRLNIERHAPFFACVREGMAASCERSDPRIGLLTPGRFNPSYAEQAHLARYLGFLLVEGADLAVREDKLFLRTIAGMKRIDALWRRVDPRFLDPLAFDSSSTIGVAGLVDAMAAGNVVVANSPGSGALESAAFAAFLPALATRLTGEGLKLPNIATWWCGQPRELEQVLGDMDSMVVAPAFGVAPQGLPGGEPVVGADLSPGDRAALIADMARRPQDYVGQEIVRLSTMPVAIDGALAPRPFTLRVFAARDGDGAWTVLPGGFARIGEHPDIRAAVMGEGSWSADVCVYGPEPVEPVSLLPAVDSVQLRRNPGTLPSRVADNLFWLGRYLERGEALLAIIRVLLGHSFSADTGAALPSATIRKLAGLITASGAAPFPASFRRADLTQFARTALEASDEWYSVRAINRQARTIGAGSRDRLPADMIRLLDAPFPVKGGILDRAGTLQRRYAALAGISAEHLARTDAWAFADIGRRIERAVKSVRIVRAFAGADASIDDLSTLLDLADSQISYRQRYLTGIARVPVIDLVALDPGNPRGLAYQVTRMGEHFKRLPVLSDDGIAEPQQALAVELMAMTETARAATLDAAALDAIEARIFSLAEAIARRYFLQGAEPLRAGGLTLA